MDIPSFVRTYPPFDSLDEDHLQRIVRSTRIEFHGAGDVILRQGGEPSRAMYVVRKGAVELADDEQVIDLLGDRGPQAKPRQRAARSWLRAPSRLIE